MSDEIAKETVEIAVNPESVDIEPGDSDALADMLAAIQEPEEVIEEPVQEDVQEVVQESVQGLPEEVQSEIPEQKVEEVVVEDQPEESSLPEYISDAQLGENVIKIDDKELPLDLVEDAVNWRDGGYKADWLKQPVSAMTEEQADVYRTIQSRHDRHRAQQQKAEEPQTFTREQWEQYEKLKSSSSTFNRLLEDFDKMDGVQQEVPQAKPVEAEVKESDVLEEKIATAIEEGAEREVISKMLREQREAIKVEAAREAAAEAKRAFYEEQKSHESQQATQKIVEESNRLYQEDDRYKEIINQIGPDGANPIARLIYYGHPITGAPMTPTSAFKYVLDQQSSGGKEFRFNRAIEAAPRQTTAIVEENDLTIDQMEGMSETQVMLKELEKLGF